MIKISLTVLLLIFSVLSFSQSYWQQHVDYKMDIEIDDVNAKLYGDETITYTNNSPDVLKYLWLQF